MRRTAFLAGLGIGLAVLCAPQVLPLPVKIVYNPSDSVPPGWYCIEAVAGTASLHVGNIVLARIPVGAAALAAQREYLPAGIPILKRIGALSPQSVCIESDVVRVDGNIVATVRETDGQHRPLQAWVQCRHLSKDELFLLSNTNPASFDSRYFGPIVASAVLGIAHPLWTWSVP